jgi:hypothetical protein
VDSTVEEADGANLDVFRKAEDTMPSPSKFLDGSAGMV